MRKAYFIRYRETKEAEFYVLADSKEEAIEMVEKVPELVSMIDKGGKE